MTLNEFDPGTLCHNCSTDGLIAYTKHFILKDRDFFFLHENKILMYLKEIQYSSPMYYHPLHFGLLLCFGAPGHVWVESKYVLSSRWQSSMCVR